MAQVASTDGNGRVLLPGVCGVSPCTDERAPGRVGVFGGRVLRHVSARLEEEYDTSAVEKVFVAI